jgi:hypothetical protein
MLTPAAIIPIELIGSIPRAVDLTERVAKAGRENPNSTGSPVATDGEQRKYHGAWAPEHHRRWFHHSLLGWSYAPLSAAQARPLPFPEVGTPEEVQDLLLEASEYITNRATRYYRRLRILAFQRSQYRS